MSYTSTSKFTRSTRLAHLREVIQLLGYRRVRDGLKVRNRVGCYYWNDTKDYRSYSGVELDVYQTPAGTLTVTTRSTVSRSHWDLRHQNRTLKLLRDLFGGHFITDAGRNRYWRPAQKPPSPAASGCLLARWHFHNALVVARVYFSRREFSGPAPHIAPTGFEFLDQMNPRFLSNNMFLPYLVAIWEEYFKSSFVALLRYSTDRQTVLKKARLSHEHLEAISVGKQTVEDAVAENLSFQRPTSIAASFKVLDDKLDIAGVLRKPYRRRRTSLYESIEELVERRHSFVHSGYVDTTLVDSRVQAAVKDFEAAVDRAYVRINKRHNWPVSRDYR